MTERTVMVALKAKVSDYNRAMASASASTKAFAKDLDTSDSRMANIVQTSLALGPALVPIGAAVVPAISGMTAALGFAAVGAGATALAFSGVGDALKALNDYQLEPTAAHMNKLAETMGAIGPAGRDFAVFLQELRPKLQALQDTAQEGMLPGVQTGIEELMTRMPQVQRIIETITVTLGQMTQAAGTNLASPEFSSFFDYIETEAAPALKAMGEATGNIIEGLGNMVMAFDPLNDDFFSGIVSASGAFEKWSASLGDSAGFQNFLSYVQEVGPKAWETLGNISLALIDIVKAAAPVGQIVLSGLDTFAKVLQVIADSPVGPVLLGAAAGLSAVSRAVSLYNIVNGSAMSRLMGGMSEFKLSPSAIPTMSEFGTTLFRTGQSAEHASQATLTARQNVRGFAGAIAPAAIAVGALGLAASGVADKIHLQNTATLAAAGSLVGPLGTAMGAAIGFAKDLADATGDVEESLRAVNQAAKSPLDFSANDAAVKQLRADLEASTKVDFSGPGDGIDTLMRSLGNLHDVAGAWVTGQESDAEKATEAYQKAALAASNIKINVAQVFADLHDGSSELLGASEEDLTRYISTLVPAAQAAGIDIAKALASGDLGPLEEAVKNYGQAQQEAYTDTDAMAAAMDYLNGKVVDLTGVTDINSDGVINNTDAILDNIKAQQDATDAKVAAFDAETAYQESLDAGAEREKKKKELEKQLHQAEKDGAADRAKIRRDAAESGADTSKDTAELQRKLAEARAQARTAKTASARSSAAESVHSLEGQLSDKQTGQSRAARDAQERIQDSLDRQAEAVARIKAELAEYTNTLDKHTVAGRKNRDILSDQAKAFNNLSDKQKNAKGKYEEARGALIKQAEQFGATRKEAEKYAHDLLQMPPRIQTQIDLKKARAQEMLDKFSKAFDGLDGKVAKAFIEVQQDHVLGKGGKLDRAGGKVFAAGGIEESHVAQMAPGGNVRVWAEPETGGESYIPHANDWRRPRALDIWEQTGRILGVQFQRYAAGGLAGAAYTPAPSFGSGGALSDYDVSRISSALLASRPLYGDVHVKDGTEFRRHLEADQVAQAGGGRTTRG